MKTQITSGEVTLPAHWYRHQPVRCVTPACLSVVPFRGAFCKLCERQQAKMRAVLRAGKRRIG